MKIILKILLYFFASLGIIASTSLIMKVINFYKSEKVIQSYVANCENVEVGMSLEEARKIIGDLKYQYWASHEKSGGIIVKKIDGEVIYSLEYPMRFAGSSNMSLRFDPITLKITEVFCGE